MSRKNSLEALTATVETSGSYLVSYLGSAAAALMLKRVVAVVLVSQVKEIPHYLQVVPMMMHEKLDPVLLYDRFDPLILVQPDGPVVMGLLSWQMQAPPCSAVV